MIFTSFQKKLFTSLVSLSLVATLCVALGYGWQPAAAADTMKPGCPHDYEACSGTVFCNDSDNFNPYVKGRIETNYDRGTIGWYGHDGDVDGCMIVESDYSSRSTSMCEGSDCYVSELTCTPETRHDGSTLPMPGSRMYPCPQGCTDGACVGNAPVCNNGKVETGEECDDGNGANADGCSAYCKKEKMPVTCTDTEKNGMDIFVKGTATGEVQQHNFTPSEGIMQGLPLVVPVADYCISKIGDKLPWQVDDGNSWDWNMPLQLKSAAAKDCKENCAVYELSCLPGQLTLNTVVLDCPGACKDGACVMVDDIEEAPQRSSAAKKAVKTTQQTSSAKSHVETVVLSDVPADSWFGDYVHMLVERDIASGYRGADGNLLGTFGPADNVTYAQMAKMAAIVYDWNVDTTWPPKNLKAKGHWAAPYILAMENHYVSIFENPNLDIDAPAPRGAVLEILYDASRDIIVPSVTDGVYDDVPPNSPYVDYIAKAKADGIISGDDGKNTFRPLDPVNRAETAKIIVKFLDFIEPDPCKASTVDLSKGLSPLELLSSKVRSNGNCSGFTREYGEPGAKPLQLACPIIEAGYEAWDFKRVAKKFTVKGTTQHAELWLGTPLEEDEGLGNLNILLVRRNGFDDWGPSPHYDDSCQLIDWGGTHEKTLVDIFESF